MEHKYVMAAINAALKAGMEILSIYNDPESDFEVERKADNSPLTIADRKAHETIALILKETPYPILSEEGKHMDYVVRKNWDMLWIVDPLDGTKEFIKRNGEFTVNIALVKCGIPIMGVIYVPVKKELYFADMDFGAYKCSAITAYDVEKMELSQLLARSLRLPMAKGRNHFVVVASRSHLTSETAAYIENIEKEHANVETISAGSSLKICLVAEGKADVYPRFAPTMEWDTAAGHAIVRAAGHEIYQTETNAPLVYNKENLLNPWFICK